MRENLRTIIADDEPICRSGLREMLRPVPSIDVIAEAATGLEAAELILVLHPDLVFLDVQMPECTGFEALRGIPSGHRPAIIFVTAFEEHALSAFDVDAVDYLLKPFDEPRLLRSVERAKRFLASSQLGSGDGSSSSSHRFVVRDRNRITLVKSEEIDWIESWGNYVRLFVNARPLITRESLASVQARLNPRSFVRISRTVIIRVDRVQRLVFRQNGQTHVILRNGLRLVASRRCRDRLRSLFAAS